MLLCYIVYWCLHDTVVLVLSTVFNNYQSCRNI